MLAAVAAVAPASAASLEPVGSFDEPVSVTSDPEDAGTLLIAERAGMIWLVENGEPEPYADLTDLVVCCNSEQGVSSIVPAPDFAASGRFYAAYAGAESGGGEVEDGLMHIDSFLPGEGLEPERQPILTLVHDENKNHYGGQLHFGPDGMLWISLGDGGGYGDPGENALDLETLLGKVLRIDPQPGQIPAYEVPDDNPFVDVAGRDEIWSYGLRNPWRFSFDRLTDDMLIADVGQAIWEEVNLALSPGPDQVGGAGANYGWDCMEGNHPFSDPEGEDPSCAPLGPFTPPVFEYSHDAEPPAAHGCSITGGYVVRDPSLEDLAGRYLYADFCVGEIRSLARVGAGVADDRPECLAVDRPISFGEDSAGRLYIASKEGDVFRFVPGPPCHPPPPAPKGTGDPAPPGTAPAPATGSKLRLSYRRLAGHRALLTARLTPCEGRAGTRVALRRGGRPWGSKRLDENCTARFRVRVRHRSTFRALLRAEPPQRSQVLKIALAKPTP